MKKIILIVVIFLTSAYVYSQANKKPYTYFYKKKIVYFNKHKSVIDTVYTFFKLIKKDDSLFVLDMADSESKIGRTSPKFIGIYSTNDLGSSYFPIGDSPKKMYNISNTTEPYLERNQYIFYKGKTFNSMKDTLINGYKCFRFVKSYTEGGGRDVPSYKSIEYINITTWLPELMEIEQNAPWARIYIYRYDQ